MSEANKEPEVYIQASWITRTLGKTPDYVAALVLAVGTNVLSSAWSYYLAQDMRGLKWSAFCGVILLVVAGLLFWFRHRVGDARKDAQKLEVANLKIRNERLIARNSTLIADKKRAVEEARLEMKSVNSHQLESFAGETAISAIDIAEHLVPIKTTQAVSTDLKSSYALLLSIVRGQLGANSTSVRACIFTVEKGSTIFTCAKTIGRDDGGTDRKFGPSTVTYQKALRREHHFVPDTSKDPEVQAELANCPEKKLKYETFATWPVTIDGKVLGILTIDAPKAGDITGDDLQKLRVFASHFAILLAVNSECGSIDTTK